MVFSDEQDLPWDSLWEYVLGDEVEEQSATGSVTGWRRKKAVPEHEEQEEKSGFLSTLFKGEDNDGGDESSWSETRDDSRSDKNDSSRNFWKRKEKVYEKQQEEEGESWWQLDPALVGSSGSDQRSSNEKQNSNRFFSSSAPEQPTYEKQRSNRFFSSSAPEQQTNEKQRSNRSLFAPFKRRSSSKSNLASSQETSFLGAVNTASSSQQDRRVRFARSAEKSKEVDLNNSQNSFFDWVGLKSSSEEDASEAREAPPQRQSRSGGRRATSSDDDEDEGEPKPFSLDSFLHDWDDASDSGAGSSSADTSTYGSSTQEVTTSAEEDDSTATTDYESDSSLTNQTDSTPGTFDSGRDADNNYNEIRLSFVPAGQRNGGSNLLPAIHDSGSVEEELFFDQSEGSEGDEILSNGTPTEQVDRALEKRDPILIEDLKQAGKKSEEQTEHHHEEVVAEDGSRRRNGLFGRRKLCSSAKDLSEEDRILSAKSGLPIHEMSPQELAAVFPKIRSVADEQRSVSASVVSNSESLSKNCPAHFQAIPDQIGPQSLFEYEYETKKHKLLIYERFGVNAFGLLQVVDATIPTVPKSRGKRSLGAKVLVQVEASTVSGTDCCIRRGSWWGETDVPLPNTPGVDVVGRLCFVDESVSKRYGIYKGQRVMSLIKWGGNARFVTVAPSALVKVPDFIDPAAAACLLETYLAAFQMLHFGQAEKVRYRQDSLLGKRILVMGSAASVVGHAVAQLALLAKASHVYIISKQKNFARLIALGFIPLDEDSLTWWDRLTASIDCIVALEDDIVPLHYTLLKKEGHVMIARGPNMGGVTKQQETPKKGGLFGRLKSRANDRTLWYDLFEAWDKRTEACKLDLLHLLQLLEQNRITPNIIDRINLGAVATAQQMLESKKVPGHIVCEPWLVAKARAIRL